MPFDGNASEYSAKKPFYVFALWRDFLGYVNDPQPPDPMPVRILREAKALIADPQHWVQGTYETSEFGITRRCAIGALRAAGARLNASATDYDTAHFALGQIARTLHHTGAPPGQGVERMNDHTSHRVVMQMFDDSIVRYQAPDSLFRVV